MKNVPHAPKRIVAAIVAVLGVAVAFNRLSADEAHAVTMAIAAIAAIWIPATTDDQEPPATKSE